MPSSNRPVVLPLLLLLALLSAPLPSRAAPPGAPPGGSGGAKASPDSPVVVDLSVERVVPDGKGGETFGSADLAKPGDVVAYTVVYRNRGKQDAKGVKGTLPVPAGAEYIPGAASPPPDEASLDGAAFAPVPLVRRVKDGRGGEKAVEVPPSEYRSLRWDLKTLSPGRAVTVRARMKILDLPR